MGKHLCLILAAVASLAHVVECHRASSQAVPHEAQASRAREVGAERNAKHNLTALFYQNDGQRPAGYENAPDYMTIRDERTGRESKPVRLPASYENHLKVWSPDEEHLVFRCKSETEGFCIYDAAGVAALVGGDGAFQTDRMSDYIKVGYTETDPPDKGERKLCVHKFVGWEGDASFVFKARAYESKSGFGEFKYDIAGRKLHAVSAHSFDAENLRGKLLRPLRPSNVYREPGAGGND